MLFAAYKDVLLFILAIYGAVLSTFNFAQARRKEQRNIEFRVSLTRPTFGPQYDQPFARLEAINVGQRVVSIRALYFALQSVEKLNTPKNDKFIHETDSRLPAELADGQIAHVLIAYSTIANALVKIGRVEELMLVPVCEDTSGNIHRGKPWTFNTRQWAEA